MTVRCPYAIATRIASANHLDFLAFAIDLAFGRDGDAF